MPTVTDNEMGGLVFYWKGRQREIQIEVDSDGTHFVRVMGSDGSISFSHEGAGDVPLREVNDALKAWATERMMRSHVTTFRMMRA